MMHKTLQSGCKALLNIVFCDIVTCSKPNLISNLKWKLVFVGRRKYQSKNMTSLSYFIAFQFSGDKWKLNIYSIEN